jgi:N utilization substance protein B
LQMVEHFCETFRPSKKSEPFFLKLVNGVLETRVEIDALIERFSKNWKINRMSCVDRNVMRIAVYELLYCQDIPAKVSINEAVDVGKKFGTEESGAFINGIMDSIRAALEQEGILIKLGD